MSRQFASRSKGELCINSPRTTNWCSFWRDCIQLRRYKAII